MLKKSEDQRTDQLTASFTFKHPKINKNLLVLDAILFCASYKEEAHPLMMSITSSHRAAVCRSESSPFNGFEVTK